MRRAFLLAWLVALTPSCALLFKSEPLVPRYYSPELSEASGTASVKAAPPGLSLRLGRVGGGAYLKERIAYRTSDHEFGFYEDRRWTERPEVYLQRAIEQCLFQERGVGRALSLSAPTLTVDLVEFEEVRDRMPRVRLRVSYALHDERTVFRERSFAIERPLPSSATAPRAEDVAAALGEALREAVGRMVDEAVADLTARRSAPATPSAPAAP